MKSLNLIFALLFLSSAFFFTSCKDDDAEDVGNGQVNVKMTDAPIDDAHVKGAYVTVAEVWVNGEKMEGFTKQTIDISAYQEGKTVLLLSDTVAAGTHNDISLVLDLEADQWGESPGCYVLTESNKKHNLAASAEGTVKIDINKEYTVPSGGSTDVVVDFDLRKSIKYDNSHDGESDYSFVTGAELNAALRAVVESNAGAIKGKITESAATGEKLVVYAYKKGEFDAEAETSGQGNSNVMFANAVTSAEVDGSSNYKLSFLEEGEYEVHVAAYDSDANGKLVFSSMVEASAVGSGNAMNGVFVEANTEFSLNINVTGLLGI